MLDLRSEVEALWEPLREAAERVLASGRFILGPEVEALEREVAEYLGVRHATGAGSGTDALLLSLMALGIGPGDEVITSPFTFVAPAEMVALLGARPVFADIDAETFNLAPESVERRIGERTKAVLPVHLFGHPARTTRLREVADRHGLAVVEDVAQALGAEEGGRKTGSVGDLGAFSFFPSKNLGGFGDGGLVATDDEDLAAAVRRLRTHGGSGYHHERIGLNARLDALQAALLRVKLPHVDEANEGRTAVARRYDQALGDLPGVEVPSVADDIRHVYHQYTVRVRGGRRDRVRERLEEAGIASAVYYPTPIPHMPAYRDPSAEIPVAEAAAAEVLSLPIWPRMPAETQQRVVDAFREAVA